LPLSSALFYLPPLGWLLFVTAVAAVAAWEWGGLMRSRVGGRIALGVLLGIVCAAVAWLDRRRSALELNFRGGLAPGAPASICQQRLSGCCWCRSGCDGAGLFPTLPRSGDRQRAAAAGVAGACPTAASGSADFAGDHGVVWLADIGAYFAGRRFGKHKLAPAISPGKTWEGAIGGAVAVLAYGLLLSSKLPATLAGNLPLLLMLLCVLLTAISILGDLFESLLKRQAGLKDSSNVLPGHGGVLDRIDSLTSTLPLVALVWLVTQP
jgi:phosphatidate cytidylyltransferase